MELLNSNVKTKIVEGINRRKEEGELSIDPEKLVKAVDFLEEEFEKEFGGFRDKMVDEASYYELKGKIIADRLKDMEEIEEVNDLLNFKMDELRKEIKKLLTDKVTGLEIRSRMFDKINDFIKTRYDFGELEIKDDNIMEAILSDDFSENEEMSLVVSDISYLSLANEEGHEAGDELLKRAADAFREFDVNAYRHGGDEFTVLEKGDNKTMEAKLNEVRSEFQEAKGVVNLGKYGLKPNFDFGVASYTEAVEAFKELYKSSLTKDKLKKGDKYEAFKDLWVAIADKKAFIQKGQERLKLLRGMFVNNKDGYYSTISFLAKGGYNIKELELEEIVKKTENKKSQEIEKVIMEFILKKERASLEKDGSEDGYKRLRSEIISRAAGLKI